MRRPRTLALALCVLAASGTLAACGGNNDEATPAAPPAEPAPAEPPAEPAPPAEGGTTLDASVGPGFDISLTQDGNPVTELPAGTYTINVNDQADIHNFHLTGPGVDESTDVAETGQTTWQVELQAGDYTFVCDPHASSMNGSFTVQ